MGIATRDMTVANEDSSNTRLLHDVSSSELLTASRAIIPCDERLSCLPKFDAGVWYVNPFVDRRRLTNTNLTDVDAHVMILFGMTKQVVDKYVGDDEFLS